MLPRNISFIDVETTGTSVRNGRIIEIGILRIENNRLVKKYKSLINPQMRIDPFIENLTGIKSKDLENAPTFGEVKKEILETLIDSVFVAHNVRFDYGFVRNEFKRNGINYSSKHFCTIKLARYLYPGFKRYNLDSIIEKFNISCINRHRAYDDAKVLWDFYKINLKKIEEKKFVHAVNLALKRPTIPVSISENILDSLPETCGVYVFYGDSDVPLYIGKSVNVKDRVLSHFSGDHLSTLDMSISQQVKRIETFKTQGELGALFLESTMVKNQMPLFNRKLRYAKKLFTLKKTAKDGFNSVEISNLDEINENNLENLVGIYKSLKEINNFLYSLCKSYFLCPKLMGLEKGKGSCFYYHLNQCNGACIGDENKLRYNLRFDEAFYKHKIKPWPFKGPILIKEKGEKVEGFLIDKWCYLGNISEESELFNLINKKYLFDKDTYNILFRYLKNPTNLKKIKVLSNMELGKYKSIVAS